MRHERLRYLAGTRRTYHPLDDLTDKDPDKAMFRKFRFREGIDCLSVWKKFYDMARIILNSDDHKGNSSPLSEAKFHPPIGCPTVAKIHIIGSYPSTMSGFSRENVSTSIAWMQTCYTGPFDESILFSDAEPIGDEKLVRIKEFNDWLEGETKHVRLCITAGQDQFPIAEELHYLVVHELLTTSNEWRAPFQFAVSQSPSRLYLPLYHPQNFDTAPGTSAEMVQGMQAAIYLAHDLVDHSPPAKPVKTALELLRSDTTWHLLAKVLKGIKQSTPVTSSVAWYTDTMSDAIKAKPARGGAKVLIPLKPRQIRHKTEVTPTAIRERLKVVLGEKLTKAEYNAEVEMAATAAVAARQGLTDDECLADTGEKPVEGFVPKKYLNSRRPSQVDIAVLRKPPSHMTCQELYLLRQHGLSAQFISDIIGRVGQMMNKGTTWTLKYNALKARVTKGGPLNEIATDRGVKVPTAATLEIFRAGWPQVTDEQLRMLCESGWSRDEIRETFNLYGPSRSKLDVSTHSKD
ncbi:hypothetical protein BST61_g6867 [Cercospora zeina]